MRTSANVYEAFGAIRSAFLQVLHVLGPQRTLELTYAVPESLFEGETRSSGQFIQALENEGLVEPLSIPRDVMDLDDFRNDLDEALRRPDDRERFARSNLGYIDDVLAALAPWDGAADSWSEPALNPWRGVGRNDPCPCGSGRKFKKCCIER